LGKKEVDRNWSQIFGSNSAYSGFVAIGCICVACCVRFVLQLVAFVVLLSGFVEWFFLFSFVVFDVLLIDVVSGVRLA
jgi:hypothetical protein